MLFVSFGDKSFAEHTGTVELYLKDLCSEISKSRNIKISSYTDAARFFKKCNSWISKLSLLTTVLKKSNFDKNNDIREQTLRELVSVNKLLADVMEFCKEMMGKRN